MIHARQQIRDAIYNRCVDLATTESRAFKSRSMPLDDDQLPGLIVYTGDEVVDLEEGRLSKVQHRSLEIIVKGFCKQTSGADDLLDSIAAEVESSVLGSSYPDFEAVDLESIDEPEIEEGRLEQPVGEIEIKFRVEYLTEDGDPVEII